MYVSLLNPIVYDDIDISDIGNYPAVLTDSFREHIVRKGPYQITTTFPKTDGRSFNAYFYLKEMPNGEKVKREWLVYSKRLNAIFCFCCRIFGEKSTVGMSSANGFNDWQHSSRTIKQHEISLSHINSFTQWKNFAQQISTEKTIEYQLINQLQQEKERLREVFYRLIKFVLFLAQQNIAFTGSSSDIHDPTGRNGNFQQLIHMCATFDPILREHLEKPGRVHYMSPKIQNELINVIGAKVRKQIIDWVQQSKYYAIILDGTTDISHIEQMCFVLRYVHLDEVIQEWQIRESFVKFVEISSAKTGLLITEVALFELEMLGLDVDDLRGQGFDNGSPMKGKNIGVQKRILDKNPRAFYIPCGNHTLNLTVNDAADISTYTREFFAIIQKIFVFLSASTNRWDILRKHLSTAKALTPKPLCTTRWSSRTDAVKPLCKNPGQIIAALREIENTDSFKPDVRHDAGSIADKINFSFMCSVCLWYDILNQVNIASKALQTIQANVQTAVTCLESTKQFLLSYNERCCEKVIAESSEICEQIGIEAEFDVQKRTARANISSEEDFQTKICIPIIQNAILTIDDRFKQLHAHNELFSFLYDIENYDLNRRNGNLLKACKKLENALSHNGKSDIDGDDLFAELAVVSTLTNKDKIVHAIDILNAIQKQNMENLVPNVVIAFRIMLTVPVSVASGERSFSKLKINKTYLRNSMGAARLSDLAIISIERDIAKAIKYDDIIDEFANTNARKNLFN